MGLHIFVCVLCLLAVVKSRVPHSSENTGRNNDSGSEDVNMTSTDLLFKKFWFKHNNGSCPYGQVLQQNGTVCCLPVSCEPGFEVVPCSVNGEEDTCRRCNSSSLQPNNVSSLFMSSATCFKNRAKNVHCPLDDGVTNVGKSYECLCVADDMKPAQTTMSVNFPLYCECKNEECYYEYRQAGLCQRADQVCLKGFQMNETGSCVPCDWYSYKNTVGCEPCIQNDTLLRQGKPDGIYVPPSKTTTTEKVTESTDISQQDGQQLNTLPGPDIAKSADREEDSSPMWVIVSIICGTFAVIVIVVALLYYRSRNVQGHTHGDTGSPLLVNQSSIPSSPVSADGFLNGILPTALTNGGNPEMTPQTNGHLSNGHLSNGLGQLNAESPQENGGLQINGEITRHGGIERIHENKVLPAASLTYENDVHLGQSNANHLVPLRATALGNESSSKNALKDGKTTVNNKAPTNYVSIHGNTFENCRIYLPNKKTAYNDVSGSFGVNSSLESEDNHPNNGRPTAASSTMIQPGRRDNNSPGEYNEARAAGNCRPEYSRPMTDHVHEQEAAIHHEDVAMMPLNKPVYPFNTDVDGDRDLAEIARNSVAPQVRIDRAQAGGVQVHRQPRQVATVAPICQNTRLQSVRHVSGYPSGAFNESEESASNPDSTSSAGYAFVQLSTGVLENDIADPRDFSTDTGVPSPNESSRLNDGSAERVSEETSRKTHNQPAVVRPVRPICRRERPVGDSARDVNEGEVVKNGENTIVKTVADDHTDPKEYADWDPQDTEIGALVTADSDTDLTKEKERLKQADKSNKNNNETAVESEHDTDKKIVSEPYDSEEDLMELKNASKKVSDIPNDSVCDKSEFETFSEIVDDRCDTHDDSLEMSESVDHLQQTLEFTDDLKLESELSEIINSDSHSSETIEDSSVEIDGSNDVSGEGNVEDETDLTSANTGPSDASSYELDADLDINAIHLENEHIKEITCRGETLNGLNSVQSGYKGIH